MTWSKEQTRRPPLRSRLHWYLSTTAEFCLLTAMCEHSEAGDHVTASRRRLAAYAKLSVKQVDRLIDGYDDPRTRHHTRGLRERGILTEVSRYSGGRPGSKRRTYTYRINEEAMELDPAMRPYLPGDQLILIGTSKPAKMVLLREPVSDQCPTMDTVTPVAPPAVLEMHPSGAAEPLQRADSGHGVPRQWTRCPTTGDTVSTNSKSSDSKTGDSSHGSAAMKPLRAWFDLKEQLREHLTPEEWDLWVRPMYFLKAIPLQGDQTHILAALPPNGRIQAAAAARLPLMRELLAPGRLNVSFTRYPDGWEISEAQRRYGKDMAPKPWTRGGSA